MWQHAWCLKFRKVEEQDTRLIYIKSRQLVFDKISI